MKIYLLISKKILPVVVLFFSVSIFPQSLQVVRQGNQTFIVERINSKKVRVIPSYGSENLFPNSSINSSKIKSYTPSSINWTLKFSASGKVFKDISFANPNTGYIVTELGAVFKSTDGGNNWTSVMNLGFPYYWYGVDALTPDTVVISGFNNQGDINSGVIRWSFDGGSSWTNDIILHAPISGVGWLTRIHFFDMNKGIVSAEFSGGMYYTTNGGKDSTSWTYVQVNSDLGWFAGNVDTHLDGNVFTTGIHFAHSSDFGVTWTSGPSVDGTFDGGVDFIDNNLQKGMTGGGEISPSVMGWTHKTDDGGLTWSARLNTFSYPIRAVNYFSDSLAFAFGGNVNQDIGGIYSTKDEGATWTLDVNTGAEMFSYDYQSVSSDSVNMWCVGSTGGASGYTGKLYETTLPANGFVPVELTNFTAKLEDYNVILNWTTATEINNARFEIQRKNENSSFITIGSVTGHSTSTDPHQYSFTDAGVQPGNYSYRLSQVDFNGHNQYSNEVKITIEKPLSFSLDQNYPNPFNPSTQIKYSIPEEGFVSLKVFNILGNEVSTLVNRVQAPGHYKIDFNAASLPSGIYFYKLQTKNFNSVKKMILLR